MPSVTIKLTFSETIHHASARMEIAWLNTEFMSVRCGDHWGKFTFLEISSLKRLPICLPIFALIIPAGWGLSVISLQVFELVHWSRGHLRFSACCSDILNANFEFIRVHYYVRKSTRPCPRDSDGWLHKFFHGVFLFVTIIRVVFPINPSLKAESLDKRCGSGCLCWLPLCADYVSFSAKCCR